MLFAVCHDLLSYCIYLVHFYCCLSLQMLNAGAIEDEHTWTLRDTEDDDEDTASGSGDETQGENS